MIKTPIFLLFSIFWICQCSSQDPAASWVPEFKKTHFNWYAIEDSLNSIAKTIHFIQIRKPLTDCITDTKDTSRISFSNMHWVDLNADGHDDFIYSGWCKPYPETHIFIWEKGDYKKALSSGGTIVDLIKYRDSTILFIRSDGCCCDYYSSLRRFLILNNAVTGDATASAEWNAQTTLNDLNNTSNFIGKSDTISLRVYPQRNDTITLDDCRDSTKLNGNITIEFKKPISGLILKDTVSNKEKWYLIMVQPNNLKIETEFEGQYFEINKTYSIGWVRKPEIEIIE